MVRASLYFCVHFKSDIWGDEMDGARDDRDFSWLDDIHPERRRAVDEMLKRADFGICPYGRVSQVVRTHDTFAELVRQEVYRDPPDFLKYGGAGQHSEPDIDPIDTHRRRTVRSFLSSFGPSYGVGGHPQALNELEKRIGRVAKRGTDGNGYSNTKGRRDAREMIGKLRKLYEKDGKLHPQWADDQRPEPDEGRASIPPLMPYPPGDSANKYWFNLWRDRPNSSAEPKRRKPRDLRLAWEGYYQYQNMSVWEDFDDPTVADQYEFFRYDGDGQPRLNTRRVAHDAWQDWSQDWRQELGDSFRFEGKILAISHVWNLPINALFKDLSDERQSELIAGAVNQLARGACRDAEAAQVLERVIAFAKQSLPQRDQTRADSKRNDLVISVIGAGEAILVADFRPYSRDPDLKERAARSLLITLDMPAAKAGRVIRRLLDIGAYRMLALRDYQYTHRIRDILDEIGGSISRREASARQTGKGGQHRAGLERNANERLRTWLKVSSCVAALNQFVSGGVTGLHADMNEYRKTIHTRIADLRESPVSGFQSLTSYIRRFDNAVDFINALNEKYVAIRDRLDEMVNLARAELDQYEEENSKIRTRTALLISSLLITSSMTLLSLNISAANAPPILTQFFGVIILISLISAAIATANLLNILQSWFWDYSRKTVRYWATNIMKPFRRSRPEQKTS